MEWDVVIEQQLQTTVRVEADSKDEAEAKAASQLLQEAEATLNWRRTTIVKTSQAYDPAGYA